MQQPHLGLPPMPVITGVPSGRDKSYVVGIQKPFAQDVIACGCDRNRLDKVVDVADVHELASKHSTCLL